MREIKFRAWEITGKKMYEVISIDLGYKPRVRTDEGFLCDGEFELMQYTGLKDKNGKEIYEGDILKHGKYAYAPFENEVSVVEWFDDNCCYILKKKHNPKNSEDKQVYDTESLANIGGGVGIEGFPEIIGNIYENSELLK